MDSKLILIVEDDEDIQEIYKEMLLHTFEVQVEQRFNGREGLEAVKVRKPDLVILDLLMPVMNGEEFLKEFRFKLGIRDVPVVICSVNQVLAHRLQGDGLAEAVLPKLFMEKDLVETVKRFLGISPKAA
ncbi:MAG: response regulator [Candidatus Omnitrophica bacterium]|nr:response regulator [Candidatus Omnitrophota bacterium]